MARPVGEHRKKRIEYCEIKRYWTTRLSRVKTPFRLPSDVATAEGREASWVSATSLSAD
jgi:hypothetical protein